MKQTGTILMLCAGLLQAASGAEVFSVTAAPPSELVFPVGEDLCYRVYWGWLPVARARVVSAWLEENGRKLIAIRYHAKTNRLVGSLYPLDNYWESVIDPVGFRTVRFTKRFHERRDRTFQRTTFDFERLKAVCVNLDTGQVIREYAIEPNTRDLMTRLYAARAERFAPGDVMQARVAVDDGVYNLKAHVLGIEQVKLPLFGAVRCLRFKGTADFLGLFTHIGNLALWASDDERHLCAKTSAEVPVGRIEAVLCGVGGPGDDFWARIAREKNGADNETDSEIDQIAHEIALIAANATNNPPRQ